MTTFLGDKMPAALVRYYVALDGGSMDDAAAEFSDNVRYAVPVAGPETQPRTETVGRSALRQRFVDRGKRDRVHDVQLCMSDGRNCLVEGVVRAGSAGAVLGAPVSTFVASITLSESGQIDRYLAFSCNGARDAIPTDVEIDTEPGRADDVLHTYFDQLDRGNFAEAAACFSEDTLYSHPPYRHTGIDSDDRVEFRSRAELVDAFRRRGRQAFGHSISACLQRGPHAILEGVVTDLPNGGSGSFISTLSLDRSGLIRRYVSFYCEPAVPEH